MKDISSLPTIPGYVDIKEAARTLGVAESSVYRYVQSGRLPGYQAGHNIMVEEEALKQFKPANTGRPRKKDAPWRVSPDTSSFLASYIRVNVKTGKQEELKTALWQVRQEELFLFPGTINRFISLNNASPASVTIQLVWKNSDIVDKAARERELEHFKEYLQEVLDWDSAQYTEETVLIHT